METAKKRPYVEIEQVRRTEWQIMRSHLETLQGDLRRVRERIEDYEEKTKDSYSFESQNQHGAVRLVGWCIDRLESELESCITTEKP